MKRVRVIPVLLLKNRGLVKTQQFKHPTYVGDPFNTMRIFNDKEVDEIIALDIDATRSGREPEFDYIEQLVSESFMPLAYGGGITNLEQAKKLFAIGVEKIVLGSAAFHTPELIREIANIGGAQSVVVSIDVRKTLWRGERVYVQNAGLPTPYIPLDYAKRAAEYGAGELMVTSVAHEGMMGGYHVPLLRSIAEAVDIPVIAHGGAKSLEDLKQAIAAGASAVAAGSMFVFQGPHRAVLISYPTPESVRALSENLQ